MWIYHKEAEHIEVITNIETGAQVTRQDMIDFARRCQDEISQAQDDIETANANVNAEIHIAA